MKEFFSVFLIEPFTGGDYFGYFIGVLMWICFIALIVILLSMILGAVDSWFMPELKGKGKIYDKKFVPAHTTTTFMKVGNSQIPIIHRHPDTYYVHIDIDGRTDSFEVSKNYYNNVQMGTIVKCKYNLGRLLKTSLYINEISY